MEINIMNKDDFQKSYKDLVLSLQNDNRMLREELSLKEKELKSMTDELSKLLSNGSSQASEQFLIASLQSARESISGLDTANLELLEALSARQDEILRLSTAGMNLQNSFKKQLEKNSELESEISGLKASLNETKVSTNELNQGIEIISYEIYL